MYCKSCGKVIDDDSKYCSYCSIKQSVQYNIVSNNAVNSEQEKTLNINLSFGRDENTKQTYKGQNLNHQSKYDSKYEKESDATILGLIILVISIIFVLNIDLESYNQLNIVFFIILLVLRIAIVVYVVRIANRQNRDTSMWGFFAFLLPTMALIIIGLLKKLFIQLNISNLLTDEENSEVLYLKAVQFLEDKKYSECIRFSEKSFELNPKNNLAFEIQNKARLEITVLDNKKEKQIARWESIDQKILK